MTCVVGIDVSTKAVDYVKVDVEEPNGGGWLRVQPLGKTGEERTLKLRSMPPLQSYFDDVALVVIERPTHWKHRTTVEQLMMVVGVVVASVPASCRIVIIKPTEWRKLIGSGPTKDSAVQWAIDNWTLRQWESPPMDAFEAYALARAGLILEERRLAELAAV